MWNKILIIIIIVIKDDMMTILVRLVQKNLCLQSPLDVKEYVAFELKVCERWIVRENEGQIVCFC